MKCANFSFKKTELNNNVGNSVKTEVICYSFNGSSIGAFLVYGNHKCGIIQLILEMQIIMQNQNATFRRLWEE